jgi:hypothetical protein
LGSQIFNFLSATMSLYGARSLISLVCVSSLASRVRAVSSCSAPDPMADSGAAFYGFSAKTIKKEPFAFAQLQGKVVLIVNVASKYVPFRGTISFVCAHHSSPLSLSCPFLSLRLLTPCRCGFTPQYTGLEALYQKYKVGLCDSLSPTHPCLFPTHGLCLSNLFHLP